MVRSIGIGGLVWLLLSGCVVRTDAQRQEAALRRQLRPLMQAARAGDVAATRAAWQALILPDPERWFREAYGPEGGPRQARQYQQRVRGSLTGMAEELVALMAEDEPRWVTVSAEPAVLGLPESIGRLFSFELRQGDEPRGFPIGTFADVDGQYRFIGLLLTAPPD